MSNFWPKRSNLESFSIEKLAKSYRAKLRVAEYDSKELLIKEKLLKQIEVSKINHQKEAMPLQDNIINTNTNHWANRDFNEYGNAA